MYEILEILWGSKTADALDGCSYPSGCVTLQKSSAEQHYSCFNSEDVEVWVDNTQRKGKPYRVREDCTTPIGIPTNVVLIQPRGSSIQKVKELAPKFWPGTKLDVSDLIIEKEECSRNTIFGPYRWTVQEVICIWSQKNHCQKTEIALT